MARLDKTVTIVRLDWAVICSLYGRSRRDNIVTLGMIMLSMHGRFNRTVTMVNLDKTGYRQDCVVEQAWTV